MKKKIVIAVVVVAVLVATTVAMYFVNFSNDIPDKELVYLQLQLDGKDEAFVLSQFKGCTREELVQDWGNPDGMLSGFYGDIWVMTENENIIVYYSADSIVEHIKLEQNEQNKKINSNLSNCKIPLGTKGRTSILSYREYVRPAELHSRSAEENCPTWNVASLRSVKVATPPCAAKAAIPCGLAVRKRF